MRLSCLPLLVLQGWRCCFQTILLLVVAVAVRKTAKSLREEAENLRTSVMPVIYDARDTLANTQIVIASAQEFVRARRVCLARMAPKIESATGDLAEIAQGLRVQTAEMQLTAIEIMERVRKQSKRLDEMCTHFWIRWIAPGALWPTLSARLCGRYREYWEQSRPWWSRCGARSRPIPAVLALSRDFKC